MKKTTVVTRAKQTYHDMFVYVVEPVHTWLGIVCFVAPNYELENGLVVEVVDDICSDKLKTTALYQDDFGCWHSRVWQ